MPLTNNVITKLNEISTLVEDKNQVKMSEVEQIKSIFLDLLKKGEFYNVEEIESWFENEGSWKKKDVRVRIVNLAHYVQSKQEQTQRLKIISDKDESCDC